MPLLQAAIGQHTKVFLHVPERAAFGTRGESDDRVARGHHRDRGNFTVVLVSRASLIHQYGLEPDKIVLPRQPCKEDDDAVWDLEDEEEADGEGDAVDEEDGNEGEDDEDDLEDVSLVTPVKKGVKRRQSGQKGKAKAKARKTKGGSQKSNPKE